MGYETRMHIVAQYEWFPDHGEELACIDLCKCGEGPVGQLIARNTRKAQKDEKPPFILSQRSPDRQLEAVDLLREIAKLQDLNLSVSSKDIIDLSENIEDSGISKDCYGDYLGVIDFYEMMEALKKEVEGTNFPYRRFQWALELMKSINETWTEKNRLKVITFGH